MKLVFVDNLLLDFRDGKYQFDLQPHLGLISLIATAESAGHNAHLYDPKLDLSKGDLRLDSSLYKNIATRIIAMKPDVVGVTSLGCNFICTAKIAKYLKSLQPDLPILLGGPHATILDKQILRRFREFDVIVRHEAEATLLPVLDALADRKFESIAGISYRSGTEICVNQGVPLIEDLDSLPWPAFDRFPIHALGLQSIRVEAGRGCPFSCTFCSTATFFGRKYRLKSADRLTAELDYLNREYGISHFSLTHDLFTVNRKKVLEFCSHVKQRGYTWSCSARMDCVDEPLMKEMRAAGCTSIYFGIETGSSRMQQIVEKRQDLAMVAPTLDIADRYGLSTTVSLITGYPQEEKTDQDDTLDLAGECFRRDPMRMQVQLHLLTPEPGTKLFHDFRSALEYDGHISDFNFPTLETDDAFVMESAPDVFMNHHYFDALLPRRRHVFVTSAFAALYELGFPVLRHLLSRYSGRLSILIDDMYDWANGVLRQAPFDQECVADYMRDRWGKQHYLSSITRYITAANGLSRLAARVDRMPAQQAPSRYRRQRFILSPRVALLPDLHNCEKLLSSIWSQTGDNEVLADALMEQRHDYCVFLEDAQQRLFRNCQLRAGWHSFYEYMKQPRTMSDLAEAFEPVNTEGVDIRSIVASLIAAGICERESPAASTVERPDKDLNTVQVNVLQCG